MKILKYLFNGNPVEMTWSESNEEIAKREADSGEYTIEDDGAPEPEPTEPNTPAAADLTADEMAAAIMEGVNAV